MNDPPMRDGRMSELFAAERDAEAPEIRLERVWSRVSASIAGAASPPRRLTRTRAFARALSSQTIAGVAIAIVVGAALGGGAIMALGVSMRSLHRTEAVPVSRALASSPPEAPRSSPLVPEASAIPPESPAVPAITDRAVSSRRPSPAPASSLAEEQALLDHARSTLGDGDGARALSITDTHLRRFAHPRLGEEREAIAIQALVIIGRFAEARARADRFRQAAPDSLFLPAVEASLASIPR